MPDKDEILTPVESFQGEMKLRHTLSTDFIYFAENILKIVPKQGGVVPFTLNRAQQHIHQKIESQLYHTKKVRALILKARQQGCSTYVAGRYYWKVIHRKGINAFILSHAIDTTKKLFAMTRRYYEHCDTLVKPSTSAASATEFNFNEMDSSYYVGTAGSKETGRGGTIHLMHGSEVAFWANADMHFAGVMQSIPTGKFADKTEIILESTANGPSGKFHDLWHESLKGNSEYITIFTPWFWQEEYRTTAPMGWDVNAPEYEEYREIQRQYSLDEDQVYWMHTKRVELGSEWLFKQEYPATAEEAFQTSGDESLIKPEWVLKARECADMIGVGPRVGACDPARFGDDKTSLGHRVGRVFENVEYYEKLDTMEVAAKCKTYIDVHKLDAMFIDTNGLGAGVYDKLRLDGYGQWIRPVNFGESALDKDHYSNKRAECWGLMQSWFKDFPVKIPNLSELHGDLVGPQYGYDARTRLKLESKDDMRKRGVKSPNGGDVLAMTFAEKIRPRLHYNRKDATIGNTDYNILDSDAGYSILG